MRSINNLLLVNIKRTSEIDIGMPASSISIKEIKRVATIWNDFNHKAEIQEIVNILVNSKSVSCDLAEVEEVRTFRGHMLKVPLSYSVVIDYVSLATAIYDAGYRKGEKQWLFIFPDVNSGKQPCLLRSQLGRVRRLRWQVTK